jgi:hypothetical protein
MQMHWPQTGLGGHGGQQTLKQWSGSHDTEAMVWVPWMDSLDQGLCGSLGHGDGQARSTPTRIDTEAFEGTAAVMVACGDHHTMVVTIATGGGDDLAR